MTLTKTEGVVLRALDFRDYEQILTVFSLDLGIQKFVYKKRKNKAPPGPISRCELIYRPRDRDLLSCNDITVLTHYRGINLETLEAASAMIRAIGQTQQPGQPAPLLYRLLVKYLESLPAVPHPETLTASFFLKLLKHDGQMDPLDRCSRCRQPLSVLFLSEGESFCQEHGDANSLYFSQQELCFLWILSHSRTLSEISLLRLSDTLQHKIKRLFERTLAS